MPAPAGAILGAAAIGAAGNLLGGKNANRPRTTQTNSNETINQSLIPYGGTGTLDNIGNLAGLGLGFGLANSPYGPSFGQNQAADIARQFVSRGLPGISIPHIPRVQVGQVHGPDDSQVTSLLERMRQSTPSSNIRSLGVPVSSLNPQEIANFFPDVDPELKKIIQGHYLNENPHLDDVIEGFTEDANRAYERSVVPQIDSGFARGGRYGSMAYASAQAEANREFNRGVMDTISGIRADDYQSERDRMMQALGIQSSETQSARNTLASMRNQDLASAAQLRMAAIDAHTSGFIAEAQILGQMAIEAANAANQKAFLQANLDSSHGIANANLHLSGQGLDLQRQSQEFGNIMNLFNLESGLQNERRIGALAPLGVLGDYSNLILPMIAQFGNQRTTRTASGTNTAPGAQINPIGSFLTGGLGGASIGAGLSNMLGGKNSNQITPWGNPIYGNWPV